MGLQRRRCSDLNEIPSGNAGQVGEQMSFTYTPQNTINGAENGINTVAG